MSRTNKVFFFRSLVSVSALALTACGGGGGGSSDGGGGGDGDQASLLPGVYAAEVAFVEGGTEQFQVLLGPSGQLIFFSGFFNMLAADIEFGAEGSVTGSGLTISFDDDASAWVVSEGLLEGTVDSEQSATLAAGNLDGEVGSNIVLTRDNDASDAGVTLEQLSATYTLTGGEVFDTTITIQEDGTLEGSDESGCQYNGQVIIPDESVNLVEVSFNAANCANDERNGDFTGLGTLDAETGEGTFAGTNGEVANIFVGQR